MIALDKYDVQIIKYLQKDARAKLGQIAEDVCLSVSQCSRRIQQLESQGVISGHKIDVSPKLIGLDVSAFVFLSFSKGKVVSPLEAVEALLMNEHVTDCHTLTGQYDVVLKVVISDLSELSSFLTTTISPLEGIRDIHTSVVLDTLKANAPIPINKPTN